MRLAALIKKCQVVTVENGWIQATHEGAAFITYLPKARGLSFAVDAKAFIDALKVLESDYRFVLDKKNKILIMFDSIQEIKLYLQVSELWITAPVDYIEGDIATPWVTINEFATPNYPAIRVTSEYFEVMASHSIIRLEHCFNIETKNIMTYKVLKNSEGYAFDKKFLWIKYDEFNFIGLSYIDTHLPITDSFFLSWDIGTLIPTNLASKLIAAEYAKFTQEGLFLTTEHTMSAEIEAIKGKGRYEYTFFKKAIQKGLTWCFEKKTLNITGNKIKIILENLDAR